MARKKKTKLKVEKNKLPELMGYKLDQEVFCKRYPDKKLAFGRIHELYPECGDGPGISIVDYLTNSYRIALIVDIIDEPTQKQISERDLAVVRTKKKKKR